MSSSQWKPLDLEGLRARLEEAKRLLEHAAALGVAQDEARVEAMAELAQRTQEGQRDDPRRPRYR